VHGQKGAGHWRGPVSQPSPATQASWAQPSHMGRVGPSPKNKKNKKNSFQKSVIFHKYFTAFGSILVCIFIL